MFAAGFRLNASSWPMFLLKTLNGAEMAPIRIFHKVWCPSDITTCLRSNAYILSFTKSLMSTLYLWPEDAFSVLVQREDFLVP